MALSAVLSGFVGSLTVIDIIRNAPVGLLALVWCVDMVGALLVFSLLGAAVAGIDTLVVTSGKVSRAIECVALSTWTQVPILITSVAVVWWFGRDAVAIDYSELGGVMNALDAVVRTVNEGAATPALLVLDNAKMYFSLWLVALGSCVLHVVSGMSVWGAGMVGGVGGTVFVVLPWLIGRLTGS